MKPYVICHMAASVDGRIIGKNWGIKNSGKYFEEPAAKIKVDAWMVGRVTMQEFSSKTPRKRLRGTFDIPKTFGESFATPFGCDTLRSAKAAPSDAWC